MQRQEWIVHLEQCKNEGMTVKAYAKRHDLSVDSLYYWRRKLTLDVARSSSAATSQVSAATPAFTCLKIDTTAQSPIQSSIHLRLGNHLHLEMNSLPPAEWLAALVRLDGVR